MSKQMTEQHPRVGGCWCNTFEENMWRRDVCVSCFHKKSDHSNNSGMCNFRKPPATKAALAAEEAKKGLEDAKKGLEDAKKGSEAEAKKGSAISSAASLYSLNSSASTPVTPSDGTISKKVVQSPSSSAIVSSNSSNSSPPSATSGAVKKPGITSNNSLSPSPPLHSASAPPSSPSSTSRSFIQPSPRATTTMPPPTASPAKTRATTNFGASLTSAKVTATVVKSTSSSPPPTHPRGAHSATSVLQRYPYSQQQQQQPQPLPPSSQKTHKKVPSNGTPSSTSSTTPSTTPSITPPTPPPKPTNMATTQSIPLPPKRNYMEPQIKQEEVQPQEVESQGGLTESQDYSQSLTSPGSLHSSVEDADIAYHETPFEEQPANTESYPELYIEPVQQTLQPPYEKQRRRSSTITNLLSIISFYSQGYEPADMSIRIMRQMLLVLNLNLEDKYVKDFCSKFEVDVRNKKDSRHWFNPATLRLMESLRCEVDDFVAHQRRTQKVIILQSLVRGRQARKKVLQLRGYLVSPHKERNALFRELIKNERMYISRLSLMVKGYMQPLKSTKLLSFSHILPVDDIAAIFSNSEVLLKVHTGILGELEMLLDKWPVIEDVGSIFLRKAPELKGYGEYVKNFKTALDTLIRSTEHNQKFAQFLAERGVASDDPGLMALISCPLNQISQYEILLERLSKATPTWHRDSDPLAAASMIMRSTYALIQDAINQSNDRAKILDVQRRLLPNQLDQELVTQDRIFIKEGVISVVEKKLKKSRYYFLFNEFKIKVGLPLKDLIIEEFGSAQQLPPAIDPLCCCNLIVPKAKSTVLFQSKTEKSDLVLKLRGIVEKLNPNTKVFGLSLGELQKREKGNPSIPSILEKMAQRIRNDVQTEGIFRISCSNASLLELRDKLEKDDDVDFNKFEVHVVTSAMKLFFREMPAADHTAVAARVAALRVLVAKLPRPNHDVLVFVTEFLLFVADHASDNKMNLSNLAIVFGPNLIKPPVVSIESTLMIPKANSIFDDLLVNWQQVIQK